MVSHPVKFGGHNTSDPGHSLFWVTNDRILAKKNSQPVSETPTKKEKNTGNCKAFCVTRKKRKSIAKLSALYASAK